MKDIINEKFNKKELSMQKEIGAYEAKTKLPEILRLVEKGESFTITNRGRPVAELIPNRSQSQINVQRAIDQIMESPKSYVSESTLNSLKTQGRK